MYSIPTNLNISENLRHEDVTKILKMLKLNRYESTFVNKIINQHKITKVLNKKEQYYSRSFIPDLSSQLSRIFKTEIIIMNFRNYYLIKALEFTANSKTKLRRQIDR